VNDFLPGIVSVGFSVCVFLYAWLADIRRIQRLNAPEPPEMEPLSEIETLDPDQLSFDQLRFDHVSQDAR
jgi:hypothetical protein